jgi:hypothetical protein
MTDRRADSLVMLIEQAAESFLVWRELGHPQRRRLPR